MITKRVDAITKILPSHKGTIIPAPRSVKLDLTARCDLKCFFCASSQKLRKKGDMDFAFVERVLREMRPLGVREIGMFFLGESLLYPRLADAIRLAKEIGYEYVFLTTNGRALSQEKAHDIMAAGLDSLKFSFNAADRVSYQEATSVDAFDTVVANIKNARIVRDHILASTGHKCGLYASSIWYDDTQEAKMEDALGSIRSSLDEHYWLPLYNQAGYTTGAKGTRATAPGNPGRMGALRASLPCWVLFMEGHITWDGMLTGCCFSHESAWDFGDLNKMSFMEAWNSDAAQLLRKHNLNKDVRGTACERCIY